MTIYFFDSSALAKRYVAETGSRWVRGLFQAYPLPRCMLAVTTPTEISSLLVRQWREGKLDNNRLQFLFLLFDNHLALDYTVNEMTDNVHATARQVLIRYPLRAADAIQLGTALVANSLLPATQQMLFISSDVRLLNAAIQEGLTVDDPNNHP